MPDSSTNQVQDDLKIKEKPFISKYARPIEFVVESQKTNERNEKRLKTSNDQSKNRQNNKVEKETWFCKSCEMSIPKSDYKRHIQGTAHLVKCFNHKVGSMKEGLGANSQGRRHPIATVLKQDRFEIEKKAIERQRLERKNQKESGKEIARKLKKNLKEELPFYII
ncbi:uncharacterized protein BX663DRAFT_556704 [Cokeromyces recurvatus]|uniref:uncharacterized protein n=1 Tax=Cokeromyces recurvatus TaxID=90255 RepID=UPI002220FA19|nr:uncharacterized protein BX663DRAFT_556704 [Cokeromyces recurvatus]KAI7897467.1 hypothetical protein BX663DRAFT_556704 [Cokeromyces recurvatus]